MANSQSPPVAVGEEYEVEALRQNDDGDGVAQIRGMTVFIPFLLPGERARVRVERVEKRFARARVLERANDALDRVEPQCPVFARCGGCQVQHMAYAAQLAWKEARIRRMAERLGLDASVVRPIEAARTPYRYRNQVQMPVRWNEATQRAEMGFFAFGSHEMAVTETCLLVSEAMDDVLRRARWFLTSLGPTATFAHHVIVRQSRATGDMAVVFALTADDPSLKRSVGRFHAPQVAQVAVTVQPRAHGPVWGAAVEVCKGATHLEERVGGLRLRLSPRAFFQVQSDMAERMYAHVVRAAEVRETDVVIDAYCGIGAMTLLMANRAARAVGVDEVEDAIQDARANAKLNRVGNAEFAVDRVERWLPRFVQAGNRADVLVFDPPRKGVDRAVIEAAAEANVERLVYVSCNPATLERDLRLLMARGFYVAEMQPFDMFPQTSHVECVVALRRG
ncbi:23S rRNA (uracil(1939)-C(5))-methyltransferase RlmD [Alicyclobacillus sendaiensis]|uniref:23S rRNA (Uracil(1939)-C(5))-methyltransferase RlmD n=1 Tax=Alicyclobacillus sendaiensis PA2 TaxID=3029425 RepID=A0ABT6XYC9_ALISE|nr:23S rRNA (uracil(1939)-C(5))-methyltransferase RlmD [Alicyclobacillus sendaiensis]MDI9260095.1 23S rRNA (uracil(1939)-C(5))-methyltransferase RlmD [Alicyclobacillus sendaiensis PA2]